jgi:hypothetical protein
MMPGCQYPEPGGCGREAAATYRLAPTDQHRSLCETHAETLRRMGMGLVEATGWRARAARQGLVRDETGLRAA